MSQNSEMNSMPNPRQKLTGFTVLVVEDNELNQNVIECFLEYNGADVAIANHGKEALDMLRMQSFDCVLMDIQMPVMDGLEATQMIRANPQWIKVPVIAVTANVDQHHKELCQNAGMNDFLAKPIDPDLLVDMLLKWLAPKQAV